MMLLCDFLAGLCDFLIDTVDFIVCHRSFLLSFWGCFTSSSARSL